MTFGFQEQRAAPGKSGQLPESAGPASEPVTGAACGSLGHARPGPPLGPAVLRVNEHTWPSVASSADWGV